MARHVVLRLQSRNTFADAHVQLTSTVTQHAGGRAPARPVRLDPTALTPAAQPAAAPRCMTPPGEVPREAPPPSPPPPSPLPVPAAARAGAVGAEGQAGATRTAGNAAAGATRPGRLQLDLDPLPHISATMSGTMEW